MHVLVAIQSKVTLGDDSSPDPPLSLLREPIYFNFSQRLDFLLPTVLLHFAMKNLPCYLGNMLCLFK